MKCEKKIYSDKPIKIIECEDLDEIVCDRYVHPEYVRCQGKWREEELKKAKSE